MSDFLARLGARHIAEPTIRPRAASRFEVASAHMIDHAAAEAQAALAEVERGKTRPDTLRGSEPVARSALQSPSVAPPRASSAVDPTDSLDRESLPVSREAGSWVEPVERGADPEPQRARPADRRPASTDVIDTDPSREPADIVPRARLPLELPAVATRVAERTSASPHSGRTADHIDTSATPDVIRVHIGRVEVRAVMSPDDRTRSRGAKAADAQGPLSLDRYLSAKGRP